MEKFYVYELVVIPDGNVCYVGKGSGFRMYVHRKNMLHARTSQYGLYRRLRALLESGKDFKPRKVFETDVEWVALEEEKRRIALYGFDNLYNSTTVEGKTVKSIDDMQRQAMSKSRRDYIARLYATTGHRMPPEVAAKISKSNTGKTMSAETVQKRLATERLNPKTAAKRRAAALKMVALNTGRKQTPEHVEACAQARRGKPMPAGFGDRLSKARIGKGHRCAGARSHYRGVSWFIPKQAWVAKASWNRRLRHLGQFKLEFDAAWTYDNAFEIEFKSRPNGTPHEHTVTRFSWKGKSLPADVVAKRVAGKRALARGCVGVTRKGNRWQARLCYNKQISTLGCHATEHAAREAYDNRFEALFGRRPNDTPVVVNCAP